MMVGVLMADRVMPVGRGALAVSGDRWMQGTGADFVDVRFGDGGLSERRWSVDQSLAPISGPGLSLAGEIVGWASPTKLCAGAPDASVRCVDSPLQPLLGEGSALWLRGAGTGLVALARITPIAAEPVVIFVPAQSPALIEGRQNRPVFSWNGRVVAVRADDLSFEAWRSPGPLARQSVTESFVVFQLQSGETVIFKR